MFGPLNTELCDNVFTSLYLYLLTLYLYKLLNP